jgi:hypothetical protein
LGLLLGIVKGIVRIEQQAEEEEKGSVITFRGELKHRLDRFRHHLVLLFREVGNVGVIGLAVHLTAREEGSHCTGFLKVEESLGESISLSAMVGVLAVNSRPKVITLPG